jgi:hypothetical protein
VEALADAVRLRALGLGARVIDVLDRKVKLVFVSLRVATILAAAVGQHAQKLDIVLLEQRHHPIIEQIGRRDRGLSIVKLGTSKGQARSGVTSSDDATGAFRRPNPRIAKQVLSSCCCFGIQQGLANANARRFVSSPISVNRMCQENAGAEQSHKRGGQFKHGNHPNTAR